jgi:uncharacterized ferritin-like protein (DUF455 family)
MLHRDYNNEVQNAEIAALSLTDFPDAPWELRLQLARQCWDETRHARAFLRRAKELGGRKGEFPVKNGDWGIVAAIDNLPGRLLIQNRLFEGGSMDVLRQVAADHHGNGDHETARVYESILADEIQHVRYANQWLRRSVSTDPRTVLRMAAALAYARDVLLKLNPRPGDQSLDGIDLALERHEIRTNVEDRIQAGFTTSEIADLMRREQFGDRPDNWSMIQGEQHG